MCVFCDIASRTAPAEIVYSDEEHVAFLDVRPLFLGHSLVVPRNHVETLGELPASSVGPLFEVARLLSRAIPRAMDAVGSFVAVNNKVSQSVPHLHVHVVPRRPKDGLRGFFWPRTKYEDASAMTHVAESIRRALTEDDVHG